MGLADRKGRIAPGLDADFAIVDLNAVAEVRREDQHSAAGYSIHEGWQLRGQVRHTLVRGRFALKDGTPQPAARGTGRYLHRQPAR
jgi:dihydroorotase-like cyclic amidohydrolase